MFFLVRNADICVNHYKKVSFLHYKNNSDLTINNCPCPGSPIFGERNLNNVFYYSAGTLNKNQILLSPLNVFEW